jgi:hypothetical protein
MRNALMLLICLAGPAWAQSPGDLKARVGYSPLAEVATLDADGVATDPLHVGVAGYYTLNPNMQLGLSVGWGRYLTQQTEHGDAHVVTVLPTVRFLPTDRSGLSLYAEAALGYGFAHQTGAERTISSHGWQAQAEWGIAWALLAQLQLELGVTFAFKMGSDAVPEDRLAPLTVGFSAPDVWLGLAYSL